VTRRALTPLIAFILLLLGLAAPAHADVCGDTSAQWVPTLGSTWTGTAGSDNLVMAAVQLASATVTTHGVIPLAGPWGFDSSSPSFYWTGATEGYEFFYQVYPVTCSGGQVTYAEGSGHDAVFNAFSVSLTRVT
jgi:hypothetical protein